MQGRRTADLTDRDFPEDPQQGDYWKGRDGNWWAYVPNVAVHVLLDHEIIEHEDGTITALPSLWMSNKWRKWHGCLERGFWVMTQ